MLQFLIWLIYILPVQQAPIINHSHDFFVVDHWGNIIMVGNNEIQTFNSKGDKIASFSNSMLGEIATIDASNPLRLLVFYKEFNQVLFLDRNLAEIGTEIDLYEYSENETELLCSSPHGSFWTYNSIDNQTVHISEFGKTINKSILLSDFWESTIPSSMHVYANDLYLLYPEKGILILDQNGQFKKRISIPEIQNFQVNQNSIIYAKQSGLYSFNALQKEDTLIYQFEKQEIQNVVIYDYKIYLSNKKSISITPLTN